MRSGTALREKAMRAMPVVALRFALPVTLGTPLFLIGSSAIGTRLREMAGLDPAWATALLPAGIALMLVPAFFAGRMTRSGQRRSLLLTL
jgi:hypothetical protein